MFCLYFASRKTEKINRGFDQENNDIDSHLFAQHKVTKDACNTASVIRNTDPNHTRAHINVWKRLSNQAIEAQTKLWQQFVTSVHRKNEIPDYKGKGLVLVAGNKDTFKRTLTTVRLLREMHHCDLDIEIWHLNDEQPSTLMINELINLNAVTRDLSDINLPRPIHHRRNADKQFQIKAAAIINSAFKEVLYLDSDNIPAQDPTFLFDTPEYKNTGALFWPDFWKTHGENKIFELMQIPCHDEWEQESGQMVINKAKSWLPLQLAWYMQSQYEIYFQFLNGDKDTFKFAWQALDAPYHMIESFLGMAGTMVADRFCGHTMLQYSEKDHLLFVHANLLKITDKKNFMKQDTEHPWDLAKRSTFSHLNTWIKPEFYVAGNGQACMDFTHREGEPDAITEDFDSLLPDLQTNYFKLGGIGGETRPSDRKSVV